ncbi:PAS domain-containing protein (plasmid) [Sinorhizobium chiapasense]|uniref:PAS domain-containing protein n=1 Tax=Sinorhizobium chiapasense TaxID=501572 RepID=UPI002FE15D73
MSQIVPDQVALQCQVNRRQLQMIIAGLGEGIILIDPETGIVWANESALALHNVSDLSALGTSAEDYRERFELKYRNTPLADHATLSVAQCFLRAFSSAASGSIASKHI